MLCETASPSGRQSCSQERDEEREERVGTTDKRQKIYKFCALVDKFQLCE